ncbi:MAG TPA: methyltransferase domain-containing protein [Thermoleophilaceae bacterium]
MPEAPPAGSGERLPAAIERALPLLERSARERATPAATRHGYLDLIGEQPPESTGRTQDLMLSRGMPRVYERWWRPAFGRIAKGVFGPGMEEERRIARLLLGLSPGDGVLDVACGTGNFSRDFGRSVGPEGLVVGIDVSEPMLTRAVEETRNAGLDNVAYVRGPAEALPFRDESFDAVCCFAAFHLFANPERALDHMTAVLTPGGRIAIFTSARGGSSALRTVESLVEAQSGMRMFERDEVVQMLEQRGYVEISQRLTGMTQFVGGRLAG